MAGSASHRSVAAVPRYARACVSVQVAAASSTLETMSSTLHDAATASTAPPATRLGVDGAKWSQQAIRRAQGQASTATLAPPRRGVAADIGVDLASALGDTPTTRRHGRTAKLGHTARTSRTADTQLRRTTRSATGPHRVGGRRPGHARGNGANAVAEALAIAKANAAAADTAAGLGDTAKDNRRTARLSSTGPFAHPSPPTKKRPHASTSKTLRSRGLRRSRGSAASVAHRGRTTTAGDPRVVEQLAASQAQLEAAQAEIRALRKAAEDAKTSEHKTREAVAKAMAVTADEWAEGIMKADDVDNAESVRQLCDKVR